MCQYERLQGMRTGTPLPFIRSRSSGEGQEIHMGRSNNDYSELKIYTNDGFIAAGDLHDPALKIHGDS